MPRAGWCRECNGWVWVDDEGACEHGHTAESVELVHDAPADDPSAFDTGPQLVPEEPAIASNAGSRRDVIPLALGAYGVGEFPPGLQRFNWGAFLLPALWGVVYNVWVIVGLWFLAAFAPLFLALIFGTTTPGGTVIVSSLIGITIVSDVFISFVRLWSGGSANRLYWEREAVRLRTKPSARPKFTVQTFPARQRVWAVWGVVGLLGGLVFTLVTNYRTMRPLGLGEAFVFEPLIFLFAQLALGVWLSRAMKRDYPAIVPSTDALEHGETDHP